jgi:hypothetical protein
MASSACGCAGSPALGTSSTLRPSSRTSRQWHCASSGRRQTSREPVPEWRLRSEARSSTPCRRDKNNAQLSLAAARGPRRSRRPLYRQHRSSVPDVPELVRDVCATLFSGRCGSNEGRGLRCGRSEKYLLRFKVPFAPAPGDNPLSLLSSDTTPGPTILLHAIPLERIAQQLDLRRIPLGHEVARR